MRGGRSAPDSRGSKDGVQGGVEVGGGVGAGGEPEVSVELTNEFDPGKRYFNNSQ